MSKFIPWDSQPLDQWTEQYASGKLITLGGLQTHYLEQGNEVEGKAPVIFIHGFFYDSYLWNANLAAIAAHRKVYALDLWGFGFSTRQPLDYGYPLYAQQVLQFMDALGIPKAILVGQSMGGGTSICVAQENPERVEKLVLVDAAGLPNKLPVVSKLINMPWIGEYLMGLRTDKLRATSLGDFFIFRKDLLTTEYYANVTRFHKIIGTSQVLLSIQRKAFFDTLSDKIAELASCDLPTLVVWGKQDRAISAAIGQKMADILSDSNLLLLENAGHVPNYDQAEKFNKALIDFLNTD